MLVVSPDEHMNGPIWCYGVIYYHILTHAEGMKLEVKQVLEAPGAKSYWEEFKRFYHLHACKAM